jgi:polyferredoxin
LLETKALSAVIAGGAVRGKKKLVRRLDKDRSQLLRRTVQGAFLGLNLWIGFQFYAWVRFFESGGARQYVERPAGIDGWLPIDALMSLKYSLLTGSLPRAHPAGLFLLLAFLGISLLLRKAFCSWLCPVGTVSEYLWKLGRKIFRRNLLLPHWLDLLLRSLKYLLLAFFLWVIARMPLEALAAFLSSPYGMIADVKMLNFFRHMGETGAIVLAVLAALSLLVQNIWCRYLCPYGALMGLVALLSPARIRRAPEPCIDCGKCARSCPAALPVDRLVQIRSAECTACLECVAVCPAQGALELSWPRRRRLSPWAVAACVTAIFIGMVGFARLAGHWQTRIPQAVYMRLVPNANLESHPGM